MLRKAFDGEVYYWYEDGESRRARSSVTIGTCMTTEKAPERAFLKACHPNTPNHNCTWTWCGSEPVKDGVKYVRADLLTTARKEARAEAFKDAITETCLDCAEGDPPAYDAKARWYYHGEGREQVGCSASKLRMLEAAATTQKGENDAAV